MIQFMVYSKYLAGHDSSLDNYGLRGKYEEEKLTQRMKTDKRSYLPWCDKGTSMFLLPKKENVVPLQISKSSHLIQYKEETPPIQG